MKRYLSVCLSISIFCSYFIIPGIGIRHSYVYHRKELFDGAAILINPPWMIFRFGESLLHNYVYEEENNEILHSNYKNLHNLFESIQDSTKGEIYRVKDANKIRNQISKLPEAIIIKFDSFSDEIFQFDSVLMIESAALIFLTKDLCSEEFSELFRSAYLNNAILNYQKRLTKQLEIINLKYNTNIKLSKDYTDKNLIAQNLIFIQKSLLNAEKNGSSIENFWYYVYRSLEARINSQLYERRKILKLIRDR
jgi:hypothetical protein